MPDFVEDNIFLHNYECVRGSPMVPLVGNIFTICTNLITNGTIGKEIGANDGYVRGSPNGKICKSTNGTVGTNFTNGNQKTLNVLLPMVPLIPMVPLVDHMVEFLSY